MKTSEELRRQRAEEFKALFAAFSLRLAFVFYAQIHDYYFHILFCFVDIVVGWLLLRIRRLQNAEFVDSTGRIPAKYDQVFDVYALWLFNPLTIIISTRGSADSLHVLAILSTLYFLKQENWVLAAVIHGFGAIHLRIYPIIYLPSIFLFFVYKKKVFGFGDLIVKCFVNWKGFLYSLIALICFALTIVACYFLYGGFGIYQYLLYHFSRSDPKHNFSPYFLPIYLAYDDPVMLKWISTAAFVPQLVAIVGFALKYAKDLEFCWFLTTFAFVSFNKVCTSQYFVWYVIFTPIIANSLQITTSKIIKLVICWFGAQGIWLSCAYLLEFQGWDMFVQVWLASLLFLAVNCWIIVSLMKTYRTREQQLEVFQENPKHK
uniref:GPI mannosyltransferase 1 n=1 Tax=Panagrolaimus sp. JU765 TaxID=591449 RepID=A0AC34QAL5_9BILA